MTEPGSVASVSATEPPSGTPPRPRRAAIVLGVVLAVVLIAGGTAVAWLATQLDGARSQIDEQRQRIDEQQHEMEDQRELIERKDRFGAAMNRLTETIDPLVGLPYATLVPWEAYDALAHRAWTHRWDASALLADIAQANQLTEELTTRATLARAQVASNTTGTAWETTLDQLGSGWVSTTIEDSADACGKPALACVNDADPFLVHIIGATLTDPTMTDWIRTGVAYHEYAHVLQFTNPDATDPALAAFGGDFETMADCYALTFLDGWSLDHEVDIDAYSYWEVSVGYGYTCDDAQRQVVRDWVAGLGIVARPVVG